MQSHERLLEIQTRLLHSRKLRNDYSANPIAFWKAHELEGGPCLSADQLEAQARVLIAKRFSSVRKMLPGTISMLGKYAASCFASYADETWPTGERLHLDDSVQFIGYLKSVGLPFDTLEGTRIQAAISTKRLCVRIQLPLTIWFAFRWRRRLIGRAISIGRPFPRRRYTFADEPPTPS